MGLESLLGLQEFEAPRISRQSAHEGGKVVSSTHRPPLLPRGYSGDLFCTLRSNCIVTDTLSCPRIIAILFSDVL